ncbi:MAG: CCA tRNA nucleotidyltransferase [Candidatus Omnitrophica bacterium]|nr:CCA tRNA nucleotidyltransferase [Candidatus Omnitrophota bacterium]
MRNYLNNIDRRLSRIIRTIAGEADRRGLPAYIVGGIVRDIILGRENLDLDIVVEGDAVALAKKVAQAQGAVVRVYPEFGTATVQWPSGVRVDFASTRRESYPYPGALPRVAPSAGTLRDDLFRRDFTINAMAVCINRGDFGRLVDEFGGLPDLRGGTIRVLHDRSFVDDPTRILRAARFEQRLHFRIEAATLRLLKKALRTKAVDNVKPPRYFAEFRKMLSEDNPAGQLGRLEDLGALGLMDPAWALDIRLLEQVCKRWQRLPVKLALEYRRSRWLIFFMASAEAIGGRQLPRILGKFPLKKEEKESILQVPGTRPLLRQLAVPGLSRSEVYRILKPLTAGMAVYLRLRADHVGVAERVDRYLTRDAGLRPDIDGEDLKRMGVKPGKEIGAILSGILYQKIDGELKGRRSQLAAAGAMVPGREGKTDGPHQTGQ